MNKFAILEIKWERALYVSSKKNVSHFPFNP